MIEQIKLIGNRKIFTFGSEMTTWARFEIYTICIFVHLIIHEYMIIYVLVAFTLFFFESPLIARQQIIPTTEIRWCRFVEYTKLLGNRKYLRSVEEWTCELDLKYSQTSNYVNLRFSIAFYMFGLKISQLCVRKYIHLESEDVAMIEQTKLVGNRKYLRSVQKR